MNNNDINIIIYLVLLALGYFFGRSAEKRHYKSIIKREKELHNVLCSSEKRVPNLGKMECKLVCGSVVVSVDYFKRFVAGLRNLVGGRVSAYESLLDRARREATLRMKAEAKAYGASSVWNIRLETSSLYKNTRQSIGSVEVLAYGTAIKLKA